MEVAGEGLLRRSPTNCCRYAVLRWSSMAVAIFCLMINLGLVLGYALYIIYLSIVLPSEDMHKVYYLLFILIGVVFLGGINITFDSVLLSGTRQAKRNRILAWVVWYGMFFTVVSVGWLAGCILWIYLVASDPSDIALGTFFACVHCLLGLVILPLMWFCYSRVTSFLAMLAPRGDHALIAKIVRQNTRFGLVKMPPHEDDDVWSTHVDMKVPEK